MIGLGIQMVLNGLSLGSIYCLVAVGLTLVFGVMGIVNFAHGELYMLGAFAVWWLYGQLHYPYIAIVLLAAVTIGGFGVFLERFVFRRFRTNPMMGLIASLGVAFILQIAVLVGFGTQFKAVPVPLPQIIQIFGASIYLHRIIIIVCGATLLMLLGAFLQWTKYGLGILASAEDSEAASLYGISLNTSARITMLLSCGLAGMAGALVGPTVPIDPWMGATIILKAFVIVIVGGVGSIRGALAVAFLLGFAESIMGTLWDATFIPMVSLLGVLLILALRPAGFFGQR